MNPIDRYKILKSKAESAQLQISKAEGALEQNMKRLKKEHNCNTISEAKKKLQKLNTENDQNRNTLQKLLDQFTEDWKEELE